MSTEPVLPELPEPWQLFQLNVGWRSWENVIPSAKGEPGVVSAYTADQMRAMFKAGREQGLESAAKLSDEYATWGGSNFCSWFTKLSAAIRSMAEGSAG